MAGLGFILDVFDDSFCWQLSAVFAESVTKFGGLWDPRPLCVHRLAGLATDSLQVFSCLLQSSSCLWRIKAIGPDGMSSPVDVLPPLELQF